MEGLSFKNALIVIGVSLVALAVIFLGLNGATLIINQLVTHFGFEKFTWVDTVCFFLLIEIIAVILPARKVKTVE